MSLRYWGRARSNVSSQHHHTNSSDLLLRILIQWNVWKCEANLLIIKTEEGNGQLKVDNALNIAHLLYIIELERGKGSHQIDSLQRTWDSHWSSYLKFMFSLINMLCDKRGFVYSYTEDEPTPQRDDIDATYEV